MATCALILNLTFELCYLNNTTMLQYGDFGGTFKLNLLLWILAILLF